MTRKSQWLLRTFFWSILGAILCGSLILSPSAFGQCTTNAGQNTVYGNCSGTGISTQGSSAFIDASSFSSSGDLCARINAVLTSSKYPTTGAVVDARGILPSSGTSQMCMSSPFVNVTLPSTVLLPAGIIQISVQWQLPAGTRIIGQGSGLPANGLTTLQSVASKFTNTALIRMVGTGNTSVEDLALDGGNQTGVNGITNASAQEGSYVKRVTMTNMLGTGLTVTPTASQSGPYEDINFSSSSATAATVCVSIQAPSRGVHGLTCSGSSASGSAGVKLDTGNNTIENAQISGFTDGVIIGKTSASPGSVLFNIKGGNGVTNVVHIVSGTDVSLMAIAANGATNTIQDDITTTTLPATGSNPTSVGIYALGEKLATGYTRYTTSPAVPTWVVGNAAPPTGLTCAQGSLYSNTSGSSNNTWYVCESNAWVNIK